MVLALVDSRVDHWIRINVDSTMAASPDSRQPAPRDESHEQSAAEAGPGGAPPRPDVTPQSCDADDQPEGVPHDGGEDVEDWQAPPPLGAEDALPPPPPACSVDGPDDRPDDMAWPPTTRSVFRPPLTSRMMPASLSAHVAVMHRDRAAPVDLTRLVITPAMQARTRTGNFRDDDLKVGCW